MMYLLGILCLVSATLALPVLPDPPTLPDSVAAALQDSEVHTNIQNDSTPIEGKEDNEEVQKDIVKIASVVIPPAPQLPPFDYSILKKQKADHKQKYEDSMKQKAEHSNEEKKTVFLEKPIKDEVPSISTTWPSSEAALQNSVIRSNTDPASDPPAAADSKDDEEVKNSIVKIALAVIPPPPELPPFDYSVLRKQKADQKQKSEYSAKQETDKSKEEKDAVIQDTVKPVQVEVAPNPATMADFATTLHDDASVAAKKDDEVAKNDVVKIALAVIPPPPELPPFDYSILRKQKADQEQKSQYFVTQEADKSKEGQESVIQDLEKPVQVDIASKPATLSGSASALQDSQDFQNILSIASGDGPVAVKKDDEVAKNDIVKIASVVIPPPPPELPPFDYSILKRQNAEQKQKYENSATQEYKESKKEKAVDSKPKEELKNEHVKPSADLPVIIQWAIPSAPFLSKLISNYPTLPSLASEWPFQRSSMSRRPRIIYPKFDIDGLIYTN